MKLSRLTDNYLKILTLIGIALGLFITITDYSISTLTIPPLETLSASDGKVSVISQKKRKHSYELNLKFRSNNSVKKTIIYCKISQADDTTCPELLRPWREGLGDNVVPAKGPLTWRDARVWWYPSPEFGNFNKPRLMQLEVEGVMIRDYDAMKRHYIDMKNNHLHIGIYILLLMLSFYIWLYIETSESI